MNTFLKKHADKLIVLVIISLFSTSLWQLASAGWIQSKAIIAQQLLKHSWNKTLVDVNGDNKPLHHISLHHRPWPWADTWPVAKLIVPQHDIEQIILAGDSGSSLAFGPGHSFASAAPNSAGTTVISAHRDTHFKFLKGLKINETILIQTTLKTIAYQIYGIQVVDSKTYSIQTDDYDQTLVLATCYPFDAISTGGTLRYLVFAKAEQLI